MFSFNNLWLQFRQGNVVVRLLFVNILVFVLVQSVKIAFLLFRSDFTLASELLAAPSGFDALMTRPWTPVTYMFLHEGLFHLLFNMIALYWFGQLFLIYFTPKQLFATYFLGGLSGYVIYALAYNYFPLFDAIKDSSYLMGASASIMAIILAVALRSPDSQIRLLFIGAIKLKYIALLVVATSFFGISSDNAGGEISHLGGALLGTLFVLSLRKGTDITAWLNKIFDFFADMFKPRKLRVKKNTRNYKMSDAEFNQYKADKMKEIDRILDKIKISGYDSLSAEEKKRLFEQGKK